MKLNEAVELSMEMKNHTVSGPCGERQKEQISIKLKEGLGGLEF